AKCRVAKRDGANNRAAEIESTARSIAHKIGARAATRRTREGERNSRRKNSRAREKISEHGRECPEKCRCYSEKTSAPGSHGGRHRAGSFELDRNSGVAVAGRRARKTITAGRAFASTRNRARRRHQSSRERCTSRP